MKRDHAFGGGLLFGVVLVLFVMFLVQPRAEGVDIKFDGVSAKDIFIAAALGRGETPEDAIKIADRLLRLTGPRR